MIIRRFADFLNKPLLVFVPSTITEDSLQLLWETGVSGVMVDIKESTDAIVLDAIRKLINGLKYPSPKKRGRLTPTLPQLSAKNERPEEPDEDDDDD
jgi:hypothetical protein